MITNTLNSNSGFITKDNSAEEYNNTKIDTIYDDGPKENQLETVNVTIPINEDIPSFREWTKKQLEEAEKQPGIQFIYKYNTYLF